MDNRILLADGWSARQQYFKPGEPGFHPRWANVFFARFVPETDDADNRDRIQQLFRETGATNITGQLNPAAGIIKEELFKQAGATPVDIAVYSRMMRVSGVGANMNIQKFNQYNRPKNVTIGIENGAVSCDWRDTADSGALNLWKLYYGYFFKQARLPGTIGDVHYSDDTIDVDIFQDYGVDLRHKHTKENFFKRMEIYYMCGGFFTRIDLINPTVSSFKYSDLSLDDPVLSIHNMTLEYERIVHVYNEVPIWRNTVAGPYPGGDIHSLLKPLLDPEWRGPIYAGPFTEAEYELMAQSFNRMAAPPQPTPDNNPNIAETGEDATDLEANLAGFATLPGGEFLDMNNFVQGMQAGDPNDPEHQRYIARQRNALKPKHNQTGVVIVRDRNNIFHRWGVENGEVKNYAAAGYPLAGAVQIGSGFAGIENAPVIPPNIPDFDIESQTYVRITGESGEPVDALTAPTPDNNAVSDTFVRITGEEDDAINNPVQAIPEGLADPPQAYVLTDRNGNILGDPVAETEFESDEHTDLPANDQINADPQSTPEVESDEHTDLPPGTDPNDPLPAEPEAKSDVYTPDYNPLNPFPGTASGPSIGS